MSKATETKSSTKHLGPYKEQEPFLWEDKRYLGFIAGVGSGKTHAGINRVAKNVEHWNPGEMGAIVAPAGRMIKDTILPLMEEYDLIGPNGAWEYNTAHSENPGIHAPNGARVLILSADNRRTIERLRGLNLAWWWVDERTEVPKRAQQILEQRLRVGNYRNGFMTTTPSGKDDTYDFFVGDVKDQDDFTESTYGKGTLYETDDRRAIVGVPTDANPFTPDDYKEAMNMDMPEQIRAQEVQGRFVEIGSGVLTRDMLSFVDSNELPDRQAKWVLGVDIGVQADAAKADQQDSDYWACAILAVDTVRNEAYLMDVQRKRGMTLRQGLQWLRGISKSVGNPEVAIESNQAQRFFSQEAKEQGLRVTQVQNTTNKEDRIVQLSIPFENGTIRLLDANDGRFNEFVNEWIAFPEGTHDDVLDSVEIAVSNAPIEGIGSFFGGNFYEDK